MADPECNLVLHVHVQFSSDDTYYGNQSITRNNPVPPFPPMYNCDQLKHDNIFKKSNVVVY